MVTAIILPIMGAIVNPTMEFGASIPAIMCPIMLALLKARMAIRMTMAAFPRILEIKLQTYDISACLESHQRCALMCT